MSNEMYNWLNDWCYNYDVTGDILVDFNNLKNKLGVTFFYKYKETYENWSYI
jgi:hypothetical protein